MFEYPKCSSPITCYSFTRGNIQDDWVKMAGLTRTCNFATHDGEKQIMSWSLIDIMIKLKLVDSASIAKRSLRDGLVTINGATVPKTKRKLIWDEDIYFDSDLLISVGKVNKGKSALARFITENKWCRLDNCPMRMNKLAEMSTKTLQVVWFWSDICSGINDVGSRCEESLEFKYFLHGKSPPWETLERRIERQNSVI